MKRKTILIAFVLILALAFFAGYTGVVSLPGSDGEEGGAEGGADRLIGFFVTREPLDLFDFDAYFEDNASKILSGGEIDADDARKYGGRLYAVLRDTPYYNEDGTVAGSSKVYAFEGVDGLVLAAPRIGEGDDAYVSFYADDGVSDSDFHLNCTDGGDSVELRAVIYAIADGGAASFYPNPVYQTPSGEVYAVTGSGTSYGTPSPGMSGTFTASESQSTSAAGQTSSAASTVEVRVEFIALPERAVVMQYSAAGELLASLDVTPDAIPDSVTPESGCAYIVAATFSGDEADYELFVPGDSPWLFRPLGDTGVCEKKVIAIEW